MPLLPVGGFGGAIPDFAYCSTQNATAGVIVPATASFRNPDRLSWTLWLDGSAIPAAVTVTLFSSPDGVLYVPCAQFVKTKPGPGGDVLDLPLGSYFYASINQTWNGDAANPPLAAKPALASIILPSSSLGRPGKAGPVQISQDGVIQVGVPPSQVTVTNAASVPTQLFSAAAFVAGITQWKSVPDFDSGILGIKADQATNLTVYWSPNASGIPFYYKDGGSVGANQSLTITFQGPVPYIGIASSVGCNITADFRGAQ